MSLGPPERRLVVTASRFWGNPQRVFDALDGVLGYGEFLLGVGDCPTGGDLFARQWGSRRLRWPYTQFHAPWTTRRKAAGMIRNHFMIDQFRPQLVLAFFRPDSRGTKDCAEYAESRGIKVISFYEGFEGTPGDN